MEKIVVDTSVAVKWFVTEPKSAKAYWLVAQHRKGESLLIVPDILLVEIVNALFFSYEFTLSELSDVLKILSQLQLKIVLIDNQLLLEACKNHEAL